MNRISREGIFVLYIVEYLMVLTLGLFSSSHNMIDRMLIACMVAMGERGLIWRCPCLKLATSGNPSIFVGDAIIYHDAFS